MKINDTLAAIILAARESVVALADEHATEAVRLVDGLVAGQTTADEIAQGEKAARAARIAARGEGALGACRASADDLLRAARFAAAGEHARLVARAACDAVENCARALERGAQVR